jgi:hypothetical protein
VIKQISLILLGNLLRRCEWVEIENY